LRATKPKMVPPKPKAKKEKPMTLYDAAVAAVFGFPIFLALVVGLINLIEWFI